MTFVVIISFIIVLIIVISIILINKSKTIKNYIYKLDLGEKEIIDNLKIKLNTISKLCNIQIDTVKIESNLFTKIKAEKEDDITSFASAVEFEEVCKEIYSIDEDYNIVLKNNEEYVNLLKELNDVNIKLMSLGTFYNKYAVEYNTTLNSLMGKIIKKKCKYDNKKLYLGETLNEEEVNLN